MSSRVRCEELLRTIDAVLSECGKGPRRYNPVRPPSRPARGGPVWLQAPRAVDANDLSGNGHRIS